ncbi:polycomb group RING finger protein 6-like [Liolophura sinensis]|uniref:polycomb group RING finger protein 6-like n=1 Tax=Liolophura sinensis TaxID=3198878 RepID=UPI0031586778
MGSIRIAKASDDYLLRISAAGDIPFASVKSLQSLGLSPQKEVPIQLSLTELNPYITCGICMGYLYEASTITECMHTFCKSCIVKHTESKVTCPLCDIIIHPTDPLSNVKLDRTLQDVVMKLVPGVVQEEKRRKEAFYKDWRKEKMAQGTLHERDGMTTVSNVKHLVDTHVSRPFVKPKKLLMGSSKVKVKKSVKPVKPVKPLKPPRPRPPPLTIPLISLVLEYVGPSDDKYLEPLQKKYVRVQSDAKISNVLKFLRTKLEVPTDTEISMFCDTDEMTHEQTLAEIQKKYFESDMDMLPLSYAMSKNSNLSRLVVNACSGDQNYDP